MPCFASSLCIPIRSWLRDYDNVQGLAVLLLYAQIGCALVGSLGALFNGVSVIDLVVSLFALVAIESGNQKLGRTYAVLLGCAIVLDVAWFILFSRTIWNILPESYGTLFVFSLRLGLSMQIIGFSTRFFSSFLWFQMYSMGVSSVPNLSSRDADCDVRNSFIDPAYQEISRQSVNSDEISGGSIFFEPAYYSSILEDSKAESLFHEDRNHIIDITNHMTDCNGAYHSITGSSQMNSCMD